MAFGLKLHSRMDQESCRARGLSASDLERQLEMVARGTPFPELVAPAVVGHGIQRLESPESERLADLYQARLNSLEVIKMVPASGAASRLFQPLSAFLKGLVPVEEDQIDPGAPSSQPDVAFLNRFFAGLHRRDFAFSSQLDEGLDSLGDGLAGNLKFRKYRHILQVLLSPDHLNYGRRPKALIPFHGRGRNVRTAMDEHFFEALKYGCGKDNRSQLHFTVSREHREAMEDMAEAWVRRHSGESVKFAVDFSLQSAKTDTLAVTLEGMPLRDERGNLVFRPGGHGSLIGNLAALDADLVFIKNIDNVMPEHKTERSFHWKRVLAGYLLEQQDRVFGILRNMELGGGDSLRAAEKYITEIHNGPVPVPEEKESSAKRAERARFFLNRPVRVCGMVVNQGEPGGGPFWVRDKTGELSLQIVEGAQVDPSNADQGSIFSRSTHFNPVDLVCGTRNYQGKPFVLDEFINRETYFITRKSREGGALLALEWPGLWNGAMHHWLTHFVEVPASTFTPVKTINDLLRPEHSD